MKCCWIFLLPVLPALGASPVVINEIHHSPDVKQEPVEFIELHNPTVAPVSLAGWRLTEAVEFTFPAGAQLAAGGYLVIAQNPAALQAKFGVTGALGSWTGRLAGEGEELELRDAAGNVVDRVNYQLGFPWPTVGDAPGYSIELINPALDNDLGGHWRASVIGEVSTTLAPLIEAGETWRHFKGTQEPSSPAGAWRGFEFDDSGWATGPLPIGYDPDVAIRTRLDDMRGSYRQFYLRKEFTVTGAANVSALKLEALFDDGFKLSLNGAPLLDVGMAAGEVPFTALATGSARESNSYESHDINLPSGLLREGRNVLTVQVANILLSDSSDCFFDARLRAVVGPSGRGPSPGRRNVFFADNAPPAIRQVGHVPRQPRTGETVTISARVTDPDGVTEVTLDYQAVTPGGYIELTDSAFNQNWTSLPMARDTADTNVFAVTLPPAIIQHRNLIRYRLTARDAGNREVRVPYADDPQPNFALFVHDGVPAWTGAVRPGFAGTLGQPFTVDTNEMNRLPVYHLVAKKTTVEDCTWFDRSHGDEYFWRGTLVYDGEVYDHIQMRPRGGVWRYAMGKNMWKFDFHRGHDFQARDNWGRRLKTPWTKLNLGACIQQGDYDHRGEQGLFESVGFRLFQLTGQPAMHSTFVQFRIIDEAEEIKAADQYGGDFWGLYLALEQPNGRFLDEHDLPDGNFYKMENGFGDPNNLGPNGPTDYSDLRDFLNAYNDSTGLDEAWWRGNFNLPAYYNYQAIVQAIHHYDIAFSKNYFYYHNPVDGRWMVVPWDLDLTWADNMFPGGQTGGGEPFKSRVLSDFSISTPRYPNISREFRNRVREIRDLLWNPDEAFRLIDEYARLVRGTNQFSLIDADRAQWDYNPLMNNSGIVNLSKAGQGRFYQFPREQPLPRTFDAAVTLMKRYVGYRATNATFSLDTMSREPDQPAAPRPAYTGDPGFPVNRIRLRGGDYGGTATFGSVKFRIAEITRPGHPAYRLDEPEPYEIEAVWESAELTDAGGEVTVPQEALRVGRLYRARARHTDNLGRASNWSAPIEFTAGEPDNGAALLAHLQLTELMYHPADEGFEFLELHNSSATETLSLSGANFTAGIDFTFPEGAGLAPSTYAVIIGTTNEAGFRAYHALPAETPLFGRFDGNLSNAGETVTLKTSAGGEVIFSITYSDAAPWPPEADGDGHSLVPAESGPADLSDPAHWRLSRQLKGSPGRADADGPTAFEFASPQLTQTGLTMSFTTAPAVVWVLESTTDFVAWTPLSTNTGPATVTVPLPAGNIVGFLRAVRR